MPTWGNNFWRQKKKKKKEKKSSSCDLLGSTYYLGMKRELYTFCSWQEESWRAAKTDEVSSRALSGSLIT